MIDLDRIIAGSFPDPVTGEPMDVIYRVDVQRILDDAVAVLEESRNFIPVPKNADQAAGMVLVATAWLEQHAPERLKKNAKAKVFLCHVDLEPHMKPDECVLPHKPDDCVYARQLLRDGKGKESCEYWQEVKGEE